MNICGPPPFLAITLAGSSTWSGSRKQYVGLWKHAPIPDNQDVYVQCNVPRTSTLYLYWQDDELHWRSAEDSESKLASDEPIQPLNADPRGDRFGVGQNYFQIPG